MTKTRNRILLLCMAIIMVAGLPTTALAAETRAYFTSINMSPAPYRVTNVISDTQTEDISNNLPQWYEKGSTRVFRWKSDTIGSVEITKESVISLEFGHQGIVLTQLDDSVKSLDEAAYMEICQKEAPINKISEYADVVMGTLEKDESGESYYESGATVQFKKGGTYLLSVKEKDGQMDGMFDYFAPIIFKVADDKLTPPKGNKVIATPTDSKVLVNGLVVEFDAYTIDGNNYFKLRDVAKAISGLEKQFEVTWNGEKDAIELVSNQPYTSLGGELTKGDGTVKNAEICTAIILKDGKQAAFTAYTINGNNYFKLRDLGKSFNFSVSWNGTANSIGIDTNENYIED